MEIIKNIQYYKKTDEDGKNPKFVIADKIYRCQIKELTGYYALPMWKITMMKKLGIDLVEINKEDYEPPYPKRTQKK